MNELLVEPDVSPSERERGDVTNTTGATGIHVVVVTTAIGTGSITVSIQGKDRTSATYQTLLSSAAIVTNTTTILTVFPAAATVANVSANAVLPECFRVVATANNGNPASYSVGWSLLQ